MNRSSRPRIAPALLALVAFAACRTPPPQSAPVPEQSGPRDEARYPNASEAPAELARPPHTEADVRFMQGMIAHHAQALAMTGLVPERAASDGIRLLAERIEVSQRDEIALMQGWLRDRGEEVPSPDTAVHVHAAGDHAMMHDMRGAAGHGALMPGMLTEDQMARLARATGTEFDRLFLEFMIQHHEGALTMVADLFGTPGAAQETEVFRFASDVEADQRMEIRRMRAMLEAPPASGPRR